MSHYVATPGLLAATLLLAIGCNPASEGSGPMQAAPSTVQDPLYRAGEPVALQVTGEEFRWRVLYAGPDGELGTGDDVPTGEDIHLPSGAPVRIVLTSADYIYSFSLPALPLEEIAVPDLTFTLEFVTGSPGRVELRGDQFCGYSHARLSGELVVQSPSDFDRWLRRAAAAP